MVVRPSADTAWDNGMIVHGGYNVCQWIVDTMCVLRVTCEPALREDVNVIFCHAVGGLI